MFKSTRHYDILHQIQHLENSSRLYILWKIIQTHWLCVRYSDTRCLVLIASLTVVVFYCIYPNALIPTLCHSGVWLLTSAVKYLAMQASLMKGLPASFRRAALYVSSRAASICVATWAIWCCIPCRSIITTSRSVWDPKGTEVPSETNLEVKDALSELDPLSSVGNCAVEATLRQSEHLQHKELAEAKLSFHSVTKTQKWDNTVLNSPELQFQSCPRLAFQWHIYSHDRLFLECWSLAP